MRKIKTQIQRRCNGYTVLFVEIPLVVATLGEAK